eukprot:9240780-Pyramimonas_sp.AAC.1
MAPKKPERRRSSKQPPSSRPARPAAEGSLHQRKQDCIAAFKQAGSDRPHGRMQRACRTERGRAPGN